MERRFTVQTREDAFSLHVWSSGDHGEHIRHAETLSDVQDRGVCLPIIIKGPTVPLMPVKGIAVDGSDTINRVYTDLSRA